MLQNNLFGGIIKGKKREKGAILLSEQKKESLGSMLLGIPGKRENIFTVTDYLSAVPNVYVEEV